MRPRVAATLTLALALAATLAVSPATTPAQAAPPGEPAAAGEAAASSQFRVTLLTGDMVGLTVHPDGTSQARLLVPARGTSDFHQYTQDGDAYLVPASAERLVTQGLLDQQLFNISGLVRQHLDDSRAGSLPLILTYPGARGAAGALARTPAPAGAHTRAVLTSVHGMAVAENKRDATDFWAAVTGSATPNAAGHLSTPNAEVSPRLAAGVDRIWLDARVHTTLDQSVPQIGGPAAWARGFDGSGVTVAVLDTGVDPTHPDLAGRIEATADFTGGDDPVDHAGHGTHVASILAGSGAASAGRYRGVAPAARLLVGKVLGDDGSGTLSGVISGMQWAAAQGADVVNLSLGGPVTRGDDPMSQALNQLSEQYGTLFVVAAGNHGVFEPGDGSVSAPASADDALAVGSVDERDRLASSSRRGRFGDTAIKPELVAPGVRITAARAAGTGEGTDPRYATYSGTSMAAPHAAGAAALLKQEHPDWTFTTLRAALTSTSVPLDGTTVVETGAGRLDVDRSTRQQVFVDQGTVDLGYLSRPFDQDELHQQRVLSYRNDTDSAATLHLSTTLVDRWGTPEPDGVLTVAPATLTIAPHTSATAAVLLDASVVAPSTYTGRVIARDGADLVLGTAVGFYKQDDTVDLTFRALDRHGAPAFATLRLAPYKKQDVDGRYYPDLFGVQPDEPEAILRVPEGDYNLWAVIVTLDTSGRFVEERSIVGLPRVRAHAPNQTIVLDARTASPVSLSTPRPSTIRSFTLVWWRGTPGTPYRSSDSIGVMVGDGSPERVSVAGTEQVDDAPFSVTAAYDAAPPVLVTRVDGHALDAVWEGGPPIDQRDLRLRVADAGSARVTDLDGRSFDGQVALVRETPDLSYQDQIDAVIEHGARVVMLYSAAPGVFWPTVNGSRTVLALPGDQGDALHRRLARGLPVTVRFDGQPNAPYAYDVAFTETGSVPHPFTHTVRAQDVAEVHTRLHGTGTGEHGLRMHEFSYLPCGCHTPLLVDYTASVGHVRTEYVTARPDTQVDSYWQYVHDLPGAVMYPRDPMTYQPGQRVTDDWLKAPFSPGPTNASFRPLVEWHQTTRFGDTIGYDIADWTDSAGHWTSQAASTEPVSRLYRNGVLVGSSDFALRANVRVPTEDATYRLEADVDHDGSLFGLSTHTSSAWTFHSAGAAGLVVLPLVDVDYTDVVDRHGHGLLDLANTAPADTEATLVLRAGHQSGATAPPVDTVAVSVSFDDGRTWTAAQVSADGDGVFHAGYRHPGAGPDGGFVSLRVSASDHDGNAVEQTLIRAYRLARG
ncbi:MAG TPA: S8 family serine peptidase [Mycobacteriales bacterium]